MNDFNPKNRIPNGKFTKVRPHNRPNNPYVRQRARSQQKSYNYQPRRPRPRNKRRLGKRKKLVLIATAVTCVLILLCFFYTYTNYLQAKKTYDSYALSNEKLQTQLQNISPTGNEIQTGKFKLDSKEQKLQKEYKELVSYVFGQAKLPVDLQTKKDELTSYFGSQGFENIKKAAIYSDGGSPLMIARKNISTKVGFSQFNLNQKTIWITIYTIFYERESDKKGLAYITLKYDFNDSQGSNVNIRTKNLGD